MNITISKSDLLKCCGSSAWAEKLLQLFPLPSLDDVKKESDKIWFSLNESDWKEAFSHHPKIGDVDSLTIKFASTATMAEGEQSGVKYADKNILEELKKGNNDYENKFGYIFIVCATGKSAEEMLSMLKKRLINNPAFESTVAAAEQNKITHLRLDKLFA